MKHQSASTLQKVRNEPLTAISGSSFVMCFDNGEKLDEKKAPFDIFAQIVEGLGEIIINGKSHLLHAGESITIPALKSHMINAKGKLKMVLTMIKKGCE